MTDNLLDDWPAGGKGLPPSFRHRCEHIATQERYALGLRAFNPLPARLLLAAYGATVLTPELVPGVAPELVEQLLRQPGWSAVLLSTAPLVILHNGTHSPARQEADLMHEFAHFYLRHPLSRFDPSNPHLISHRRYEEEARYLGSCLQIPQRGLAWASQRGWTEQQVAKHFGASRLLVRWRSNVTQIQLAA